jgi:phage-related protein (TIGR01555 family)
MPENTNPLIKLVKQKFDGWVNSSKAFGTSADPLNKTTFQVGNLVTQTEAEGQFEHDWVFRKIVETIPQDSFREGITLKIPEDQDLITDVMSRMENLSAWLNAQEAQVLSRIHGGSLIIVGALDGGEPEEPLNENNIETIRFLTVLDRWDLLPSRYYNDPLSPDFGKPEIYRVQARSIGPGTSQRVPNRMIHESRVIRFDGDYLTTLARVKNQGWHASILQDLREPLRNFGVAVHSGSQLLQDFVTKILKSENLMSLLAGDDDQLSLMKARVNLMGETLSQIGILHIGEGEEFTKVQSPITHFVNLMTKYEEYVAAPTGIPRTRFFGQQLGKLAGASETTKEYYDFIRSTQKEKLSKQIKRLIRLFILAKDGINKGVEPGNWSFEFNPLTQESSEVKAKNRHMQAQTDDLNIENGLITNLEARNSRFGPEGSLDETVLDPDQTALLEEFNEPVEEEGEEDV